MSILQQSWEVLARKRRELRRSEVKVEPMNRDQAGVEADSGARKERRLER